MYARVTLLEIDTTRSTVDTAFDTYRDQVLPEVRKQDGYRGAIVMSTPEGKGAIVTFWDSSESADASAASGTFYADVLAQFVTLFRSPPGRERYEVLLAEMPTPAVT